MGGITSGRRRLKNRRKRVEDYPIRLSVKELNGKLWQGAVIRSTWRLRNREPIEFMIRVYDGFLSIDCSNGHSTFIELDRTPCHFGMHRTWFRCPGEDCGRRVMHLYFNGRLRCRHCLDLTYQSRHIKNRFISLQMKILSLHSKYGLDPDDFKKPKWMHWQTYFTVGFHLNDLYEAQLDTAILELEKDLARSEYFMKRYGVSI